MANEDGDASPGTARETAVHHYVCVLPSSPIAAAAWPGKMGKSRMEYIGRMGRGDRPVELAERSGFSTQGLPLPCTTFVFS